MHSNVFFLRFSIANLFILTSREMEIRRKRAPLSSVKRNMRSEKAKSSALPRIRGKLGGGSGTIISRRRSVEPARGVGNRSRVRSREDNSLEEYASFHSQDVEYDFLTMHFQSRSYTLRDRPQFRWCSALASVQCVAR